MTITVDTKVILSKVQNYSQKREKSTFIPVFLLFLNTLPWKGLKAKTDVKIGKSDDFYIPENPLVLSKRST